MSLSDLIGQTLGQYRIETPIDAGGMGQVYRGVHIYLNRPAAIKVMRAHLIANPSFRERFLQEARSAAALKHQNIVDIYEFGEEDGQLYLVMELVPDGSLRSLLYRRAKQPWSLALGLDLMRQAADGLMAAHTLGVVHRDIKPDNLLLLRVNAPDTTSPHYHLKISDFGLARLAEGSGLTATGMPMGTLAYMSPEQCLGNTVDGRTDIYALGVVIYEIATGYLPFQIESFEDALRKHTGAMPTPPSQVRSDVPPALEAIIMRCLAKKPEERYQTGAELAIALQGVMQSAELRTIGASSPSLAPSPYTNDTAVRAVGNTPAPLVATLQGYSAQPRVRVLDQSGQTIQVAEVTNQGITIGRQVGNAIVIPSDEISRQHAQVRVENGQVAITDLGSSNGTLMNDKRLQPHVSQLWPDRQLIRVGPFWLRLEGAAVDGTVFQAAQYSAPPTGLAGADFTRQTPPVSRAYTSGEGSGRIGVRVEPISLTITPGQPANTRVTLTNLGVLVDWLTVTVEGVSPEWVRGPAGEVQLNPGMQEAVDLGVNVTRSPASRAQDYPVIIRARSREKPNESGTAQARWTVLPFTENALRVEPRRASGRGSANYTLTVANNGNVPTEHAFNGEDDEQKISYQFRQEALALEPGKEARVPFTVAGKRRLFGKDQSQRFQIHSQVRGKTPLTGNAEFVNKPLIPTWLLTAVGVLLALALVLGSLLAVLNKPTAPTIITTNPPIMATAPSGVTPPPNSVPPMALTVTPLPTATQPAMQGMTPPPSKPTNSNVFIQQANTNNTSNNFTVINATLTNMNPNAGVFITQNVTPGGNGQQFNPHETGVWFENTSWAIFNEDDMQLAQQSAFNVWIPKNANATFIQQATTANISGSGTAINNPQVNSNPNAVLLVTQNWNPNGNGGVFDPHPVGVAYDNGSWVVFNEDGAAMPPQASFNVHVLMTSASTFVQTTNDTNMKNGGTVIDNSLINQNPHAIILVTQLWNPAGGNGVYNSHPVGVAFNGTNWEIVNEDQTPIPQGASFNVVIVQH